MRGGETEHNFMLYEKTHKISLHKNNNIILHVYAMRNIDILVKKKMTGRYKIPFLLLLYRPRHGIIL